MRPEPLEGINILEFGNSEAAGICTRLVSDFGADVTRVEFRESDTENDTQLSYRICDKGKKKRALDLSSDKDYRDFKGLVLETDAIVNGMQPWEMERAGLFVAQIRNINPGVHIINVTPYGTKGPYADRRWSEACVQAESGFVSTTGERGKDPVRCGGDVATFAGGMNACAALLMCLHDSINGHKAREVDVSIMDSIVYGLENQLSLAIKTKSSPKPMGNRYALSAPVGNFTCKDKKEIMISVATQAQWESFSKVLGHEEWLEIPEFASVSKRLENVDMLCKEVSDAFMEYERDELMEMLQSRSCIYGCINTFDEVVNHPQVRSRNIFQKNLNPDGTFFWTVSNPVYCAEKKG